MDVAAPRYQPRVRAEQYRDREANGAAATMDDSGGECKLVVSPKVHMPTAP